MLPKTNIRRKYNLLYSVLCDRRTTRLQSDCMIKSAPALITVLSLLYICISREKVSQTLGSPDKLVTVIPPEPTSQT